MSEYELLRAEILANFAEINNCCNILYTAVATILAFAVQSESYLLCMVPYFVIVPIFFLCESKNYKICRIAAYICVFLENDNTHQWERMNDRFGREYPKDSKGESAGHMMYYIMSGTCTFLSVYKLYCSEPDVTWKRSYAVGVIVLTVIVWIIMKYFTVQYVKTRGNMIDQWKEIRKQYILKGKHDVFDEDNDGLGRC